MKTSPLILHIETSSEPTSVAISRADAVIGYSIESQKNLAADRLHDMIEEVLKEAQLELSHIDAVAVSGGPGSYTGLRIGVSAAKGIAYALDIPLIHVETFHILQKEFEQQHNKPYDFAIPLMDARRKDAFTAVLNNKGEFLLSPQCLTIEDGTFNEWLDKDAVVVAFGYQIEKFQEILQDRLAIFASDVIPRAKSMASLAYQKFTQNKFEDVAYFEPQYYKSFYTATH